jgi:hypothetical protein
MIWVPLAVEDAQPLANEFPVACPQRGWSSVTLNTAKDLDTLADLLGKAYDQERATHAKVSESGVRGESTRSEGAPPAS